MKIQSFLPVFPGFYGTCFEADEDSSIEDGKTYDDYIWDYHDYNYRVCRACVNAIENQLKYLGFDIKVKFEGIASPKEYNFSNDSINVTFRFTKAVLEQIKRYLIDNIGCFDEYIKGRYTSCSGFISWYSSSFITWLDFVTQPQLESNMHYLGSILNFILLNEKYDDYALYDDIDSETWVNCQLKEVDIEPVLKYDFWGDLIPAEIIDAYVFNPDQLTLNF